MEPVSVNIRKCYNIGKSRHDAIVQSHYQWTREFFIWQRFNAALPLTQKVYKGNGFLQCTRLVFIDAVGVSIKCVGMKYMILFSPIVCL